jgi:adenylate kinase family enzyme
MKRVVIMGRGASGKSALAKRVSEITGVPVIELDKLFWRPGLAATPRDEWAAVQRELVGRESWILEGRSPLMAAPPKSTCFATLQR